SPAVWRDRQARRGGVPGAAGVVGTQKAATAATSLHSLLLWFCWWGGLRRPVAAVAGVGFLSCFRVLAKSEEPPPHDRGRERTTSGAATQRPRPLPQRRLPRPPSCQRAPPNQCSPSAPACSPPARSGSERLRRPPQVGPQATHPVHQRILGHSEVYGDIGVSPAVYDPAFQ